MACKGSENLTGTGSLERHVIPLASYDFNNRNVIVTGGAQGIGRCIAFSYAANGANIHILDINENAGQETVEMISRLYGKTACFYKADLSDESSLQNAVSQMSQTSMTAGLSVLVNNGAVANAHAANLKSPDLADFDLVLDTNLRGPFVLTRLVLPWLAQVCGNIINIASTRAFMSEPDSEAYAASKGGIISLTHAMAMSIADREIRVNCISPGWIAAESWQEGSPPAAEFAAEDHRQHPAGRIGRPADIAAACLFLSSDDAGFITGTNLIVDGGMTRKMIYR